MNITSIDNCYEEDGLSNLFGLLMGMNIRNAKEPNQNLHESVIVIFPEYRDGRLDRLNVGTLNPSHPELNEDDCTLMQAIDVARVRLEQDRQKAEAKANEPISVDFPSPPALKENKP